MGHLSTNGQTKFGRARVERGDIVAAAIALAFFVCFFGWIIFGGDFIIGGDAFIETHPLRAVFWSALRHGELLLWTPHIFSGYPLLSIAQLAVGYPLTWGYLFLPSHLAEEIYILAPFLLSPIFTYAYAREINLSRMASLLAGLSFGYGGMMTIANGVIGLPTNGMMWLPLVLIALERARRRRDDEGDGEFLRPLIFATLAFSMSVLNGHGQSFAYAGALAAAYALFLTFFAFERGRERVSLSAWRIWWRRVRPLAVCLCAFALSAGVAAFQILETLRAVRRSTRRALSYETFTEGSFTLRQAALSFVSPLYNFIDVTAYVSPLAFLLALFAVACALRSRRHGDNDADAAVAARVYFWFGVAFAAFVLMLGSNTPFYRLVYYAPLLNRFRVPSRHAFEWTFALSILAACGWDMVAARLLPASVTVRRERLTLYAALALMLLATFAGAYWFWSAAPTLDTQGMTKLTTLAESRYIALKAAFTALTLLLLWLAWRVAGESWRKALLLSVVLLVSFVEPYIIVNRWWSHFVKPASRFSRVAPVTRLLQQFSPAEGRIYTRFGLYLDEFLGSAAPFDAQNRTALYGLHNVAGYDPLILERYSRALGDVNFDGVTARRGSPDNPSLLADRSHVLDLLNTRFLVTFANFSTVLHRPPDSLVDASNIMMHGRWEVAHEEGNVVMLRNTRALPRAWLATSAEAVDGEAALRRIRGEESTNEANDFDPRRTALMEVAPAELPALTGGELVAGSGASIVSYDSNHIAIETKADKPTVLVVSEIFYPGWEATIDGQPARVHLTNYLLRGVYLQAGSHRVEMRYRAPALRNGAMISVATLLLLCVLGMLARRAQRRRVGKRFASN